MTASAERGGVALELVLGLCLLLLPATMLAGALPTWIERESAARLAAREAARVYVLAGSADQGAREARRVADEIVRNHRFEPTEFSLRFVGSLRRGSDVTAEVRTHAPVLRVPGMRGLGRFTLTARHTERVDDYRSW